MKRWTQGQEFRRCSVSDTIGVAIADQLRSGRRGLGEETPNHRAGQASPGPAALNREGCRRH